MVYYTVNAHIEIEIRGCTGFDAVIGRIGLRVRALFPFLNEHLKRNDKSTVVYANFGRESRLAA